MKKPLKVIYIAGTGRCGSTMLESLLGNSCDILNVGELRYFWNRGIIQNRLCGTGEPFLEHPQWRRVVHSLYGSDPRQAAQEFSKLEKEMRIRTMMGPKTHCKQKLITESVREYSAEVGRLLGVISQEFGQRIIVDSSKMPMHGYALAQIPGIEVLVVHLVRDLRAVVHSWSTPKFDKGKGGMMGRRSVAISSLEWVLINRWISRYLGDGSLPYLRVEYEEFCENPMQAIESVADFAGLELRPGLIDNREFENVPSPTISGNPVRFLNGPVLIQLDERWREKMSKADIVRAHVYSSIAKAFFFL